MNSCYPNFFILGAAKAGTTTLADILRQHPHAYLPFDKEPMFFSRDAFYQNGFDWYTETYFQKACNYPVRGEASPHYLYWADKVSPRIHKLYAGKLVRFVVILRNPVDRAYSWYWNMIREGLEDLSFEKALAEEPERLSQQMEELRSMGSMRFGYVQGGRYADQISHFLEYFERDQFVFLLQDNLRNNFNLTCEQMFRFLELENHEKITVSVSNSASMPRSRWLQGILQKPSSLKEFIKRHIPQQARYRAKKSLLDANAVQTQYPPMNINVRQMLQNQFKDENQKLSELINLDLSSWNHS